MSLATRCTFCGTVFRVVQDQLKVSEGWVRCGRCEEVFNASVGLFDLERDATNADQQPPVAGALTNSPAPQPHEIEVSAPKNWTASAASGGLPQADAPALDTAAPPSWRAEAPASAAVATVSTPIPESHDVHIENWRNPRSQTPAAGVDIRDRNEFADARFNTDLLDEELLETATPASPDNHAIASVEAAEGVINADGALSTPKEVPSFLKDAERAALRRRPRVRAAYFAATLLLGAGLMMQVLHHARDFVSELLPQSTPLLTAWCKAMNCVLEAPRRISNITVENTAISRVSAASEAVRLSVTLRNRGGFTVALPSVDLSLTDANGQLIARRVLSPVEFGAASRRLAGGSEVPLQLHLSTGSRRISGYTIEIFYP